MKKNIAVIGGGDSSEVVISIKSASQLISMMDGDRHNLFLVHISNGKWEVLLDNDTKATINKDDFSFIKAGEKIQFDFAYITIHGTPGEDGILQSYFELLKIPYSSCNVFTSSLTFNKHACKTYLKDCDIKFAKGILLRKGEVVEADSISEKLKFPCFIKPNNGGSSFGVSKVDNKLELKPAILSALEEDNEVLIEEFIDGIELTNGAYMENGEVKVLPITEIVSENDFFDFNAKYEGKSQEITPARLTPELTDLCKDITAKIYKTLNCKGIVRVDYILSEGEFYMLEINTVPGMSAASIIPQQIRAAGLKEKDVFNVVIEECSKTNS